MTPEVRNRCGVRGSPIEHSLSPVLHRAAYRALGLTDWSYDRVRVEADELSAHVRGLDESWRGLSLTMPLKEAAFDVVHTASELAVQVGAINTLVRDGAGWTGHNTDVYGIVEALREAGVGRARSAVLVGAGATARSALAALADLGAARVSFMVRDTVRPGTLALARELELDAVTVPMGHWPFGADVIVSTIPATAYAGLLGALPEAHPGSVVLDCVYGDGPSPLLGVAEEIGYAVVGGTDMLLHQAREQVRLITGLAAPTEAMRAALLAAADV
ncbi:MAG TPA: shikimate dehydrogenase [Phycicoccus elongatus]|nr:shikimate dehydrogenase [Phycicoccus elongatus]